MDALGLGAKLIATQKEVVEHLYVRALRLRWLNPVVLLLDLRCDEADAIARVFLGDEQINHAVRTVPHETDSEWITLCISCVPGDVAFGFLQQLSPVSDLLLREASPPGSFYAVAVAEDGITQFELELP